MPFHRSTITFDEAPRPSTKRPLLTSASAAAVCASSAGPRVKTLTIPVTSRSRVAVLRRDDERREAVESVDSADQTLS